MNQAKNEIPLRRSLSARLVGTVLVVGVLASAAGMTVASASEHSHTSKSVVISTFTSAKLGTILSDGRTLYTLQPNGTACTTACHKFWIPVLLPKGVTKASAGAGVSAAKLGTRKVTGGVQVTYGGRALFWFFKDKAAGQVTGNVTDTWGKWADIVLVKPAGKPPTTTTTTGGGGGGGGVGF